MNEFLSFNRIELWHIAGWTMLHYLWLGTLVAAVAVISRLVLRRASPNVRYAAALGWLMLLAFLPVCIAVWLSENIALDQVTVTSRMPNEQTAEAISPTEEKNVTVNTTDQGIIELSEQSTALSPQVPRAEVKEVVEPLTKAESSVVSFPTENRILLATLESCVSYLPWLWIVGTPLTFTLLAAGVVGTRRLRHASRVIDERRITDILSRLSDSLRVSRRIGVAVCERIAAPVLIGILRPIILPPPAALTGWSPDEIEMVLLHELAHVRRWDNLVNLGQRIIESLLFFHPAVWLVSTWVRREREACCDALVVARTNRPHAYAELLVALAAQMPRSVLFHPAASSAMAAGPLRSRIRRILGLHDDPMLISGKSFALVLAALLAAATLAVLYVPTIGQAEEPTTEATESTDTEPESRAGDRGNKKWKNAFIVRSKFVPSNSNVLETRSYRIVDSPRAVLDLDSVTAVLSADESEPRPAFGHNWSHDFTRLEVVAPREGQEFIASLIREALAEANSEPGGTGRMKDSTAAATRTKSPTLEGQKPVDDWPAGIVFPSPKEGEISRRVWQLLGLKLAPVTADDRHLARSIDDVKIVDGAQFPGASGPMILNSINKVQIRSFDHVASVLDELDNHSGPVLIDCTFTDSGGDRRRLQFAVQILGKIPAQHDRKKSAGKFPALEERKLADLVWKRLLLELEPIGEEDLKRVRALRYDGGVKVIGVGGEHNEILTHDILVGLHVWPTTTLKDVAEVLNREDLAELNPLKFYVVSNMPVAEKDDQAIMGDVVRTGRISVSIRGVLPRQQMEAMRETGSDPNATPAKATPASDPDLPRYEVPSPEVEAVGPSKSQPANPNPFAAAGPSKRAATNRADSMRGAADGKENLRYDGKTFDEWRDAWQTELSNEKRMEAVKALAAFGRAGYGKEAVEAIIEVAGQYDFYTIGDEGDGKVEETVLDELVPNYRSDALAEHWLPALQARIEKDPKKWRWFAEHLLNRLRTNDEPTIEILHSLAESGPAEIRDDALGALVRSSPMRSGGPRIDDKTRGLLARALNSDDKATVRSAMYQLLYYPQFGGNSPPQFGVGYGGGGTGQKLQLVLQPEFMPLLFHADEEIRREARRVLRPIDDASASPVVERLLAVLKDESRKRYHVEAIRGLAAMGAGSKEAVPFLRQLLKDSDDKDVLVAALSAAERITKENERPSWPIGAAIPLHRDELDMLEKKLSGREPLLRDVDKEYDMVYPQEDKNLSGGGFYQVGGRNLEILDPSAHFALGHHIVHKRQMANDFADGILPMRIIGNTKMRRIGCSIAQEVSVLRDDNALLAFGKDYVILIWRA